jgi:hypothetical protein
MANESERSKGSSGAAPPSPGAQRIPGHEAGADEAPAHAFASAAALLGELKAYASYYLAARIDGVKLTLRKAGLYAALGVIGGIAGGTLVVVATALLILGLSNFINFLFGLASPRLVPWTGELITGLLLLGGVGAGAWWGIGHLFKTSRQRTVDKYERQRHEQRVEYGHDVHERARHG